MTFLKKIYRRWCDRTYKGKMNYLRAEGACIGEGTRLDCRIADFGSEPYLVRIGKDCLLSSGVKLITHDGGIKVLNALGYFDGIKMDKIAPIEIGNNVYIGMEAFIMPGVKIGDNCIISGRAVVTHDIPNNSVAAGVPAKVIKTLDEYYEGCLHNKRLYPTGQMSRDEKRKYFDGVMNNL